MRKAGWQTPAELRALRLQAPGASGGGELPRPRSKPSSPRAARLRGPAREQSPALPRTSNGRMDFPGTTQEET